MAVPPRAPDPGCFEPEHGMTSIVVPGCKTVRSVVVGCRGLDGLGVSRPIGRESVGELGAGCSPAVSLPIGTLMIRPCGPVMRRVNPAAARVRQI